MPDRIITDGPWSCCESEFGPWDKLPWVMCFGPIILILICGLLYLATSITISEVEAGNTVDTAVASTGCIFGVILVPALSFTLLLLGMWRAWARR